jgi:hypothetical protein
LKSHLSFIALALLLALAGCDRVRSGWIDPVAKINQAFAVPADLQQAQRQLETDPDLTPAESRALQQTFRLRLQRRAETCSHGLTPGRFETADNLRRRITDTACFLTHDRALQQWVGLHRFLLAMHKPPLVPFTPLAPLIVLPPLEEAAVEVVAARSANVLVLRSAQGQATTVALPSGRTLCSFGTPAPIGQPATLSPNGRVLAVLTPEALRLIDPETGDTLWTSIEFNAVRAWLPAIDATLLAHRDGSGLALLDLRDGTVHPYPLELPALSWSIAAPGTGRARQVLGNQSTAWVVDHARNANGSIAAMLVEQRDFPADELPESTPLLMARGSKLVYPAAGDLGWLDLDTGVTGAITLSPLLARGFSKNSETTVLLELGPPAQGQPRLLDIERTTLSHIGGKAPPAGPLVPLSGRDGWVRHDAALSLGYGLADNDAPEPVGQVIAGMGRAPP